MGRATNPEPVEGEQIAFRESSDRHAIMLERQVGGQCLITQRADFLMTPLCLARPCSPDDRAEQDGHSDRARLVCSSRPKDPPRGRCLHVSAPLERNSFSSCKRLCITGQGITGYTRAWVASRGEPFSSSSTRRMCVRGRDTWVSCPPYSATRSRVTP